MASDIVSAPSRQLRPLQKPGRPGRLADSDSGPARGSTGRLGHGEASAGRVPQADP